MKIEVVTPETKEIPEKYVEFLEALDSAVGIAVARNLNVGEVIEALANWLTHLLVSIEKQDIGFETSDFLEQLERFLSYESARRTTEQGKRS